ncbi:hypothetical protein EIP91_002812 [Steccherinum ochraceum]|uniref:Uncharacterized protein n=1 Tax=Steccherinum ochraceum TaxID=92696 RepID=A0A4R0RDZ8_9APHY|nr:hypothetical protein EIP91_002812 [Steccherinum ochraceum]
MHARSGLVLLGLAAALVTPAFSHDVYAREDLSLNSVGQHQAYHNAVRRLVDSLGLKREEVAELLARE